MYIADANALIRYGNNSLPQAFNRWFAQAIDQGEIHISALTRTEFLAKPIQSETEIRAAIGFLDLFPAYILSPLIADLAGRLRSQYLLGLADSVVAATALFFSFPVITEDLRGFHKVRGLQIVRPSEMRGL